MSEQHFDVKISIVTVCFNSAKTIEQTIKSVINQSYKNIEYIVIDGGSTDGTLDIIKKYEQYISYWVSEPDKGIYDAMNKGISVATGDLIAFINSDDWYDENAMLHFAKAYQTRKADVLYGDIIYINEDGTEQYESNQNLDLNKMLYTNKLCHQGICVRTELMKIHQFDLTYKIVSDYDFLLKIFIAGASFAYVGNFLIAYFRRSGVSTSYITDAVTEMAKIANNRSLSFLEDNDEIVILSKVKKLIELRKYYGIQQKIFRDLFYQKCHLNNYLEIIADRYVIFGSGMVGRQLLKMLLNLGGIVECFIDSNPDLCGEEINGVKVMKPQEVFPAGQKVLISSYEYSDEMAHILEKNGFNENRDYYKYDTWVKWLNEHIEYIS